MTSAGFTTLAVDANGGFNATVPGPGTYTFSFKPQNSQGTVAASATTVTLTFPTATNLTVNVVDGTDKTTPITDYRWIIEEDRTFYINPACTANPPPAGCPSSSSGIVPTFGTNFHTSYMPVVAAGCTGPLSCESGQTLGGILDRLVAMTRTYFKWRRRGRRIAISVAVRSDAIGPKLKLLLFACTSANEG